MDPPSETSTVAVPPTPSKKTLVAVGKPRHGRRYGKGFVFLNFARCGSCGYAITAERHIKKSGLRFLYYRCTHKNKKLHCDGRSSVRQEQFCAASLVMALARPGRDSCVYFATP